VRNERADKKGVAPEKKRERERESERAQELKGAEEDREG